MGEIELVGRVEVGIACLTVGTGVCGCGSKVGFAVERLGEHSESFVVLNSL